MQKTHDNNYFKYYLKLLYRLSSLIEKASPDWVDQLARASSSYAKVGD